jgi:hypothetical protein
MSTGEWKIRKKYYEQVFHTIKYRKGTKDYLYMSIQQNVIR